MKVLISALPLLWSAAAMGQSMTLSATGASLAIDSPCARTVSIAPDPSLSNRAELSATASNKGEIEQLAFESGATAKLRIPAERCWRPAPFANNVPTLAITIRVPPHFPIAIDESAESDYRIGPVGGAIAAEISGAARLRADSATELTADISGSGDIAVGRATGRVKGDISGNGDIRIDSARLTDLTLELSGSGSFTQSAGSVGRLSLSSSGDAAVRVDGTVGDATVEISGSGKVTLARLTGRLTQDVSGDGRVEVVNK